MPHSGRRFFSEATKRACWTAWEAGHAAHFFIILGIGAMVFLGIHFEEHPMIWLPFAVLLLVFGIAVFHHAYRLYWEAENGRELAVAEIAKVKADFEAERDGLQKQLDEKTRRIATQDQLGIFLSEGQHLMGMCNNEKEPPPQEAANEWATKVEALLREHFGEAHVHRFRSGVGFPTGFTSIYSPAHRDLSSALRIRVANLERFLAEMA
jgi:hypothetical protein